MRSRNSTLSLQIEICSYETPPHPAAYSVPMWLSGQVVNYAKTLPERSFSLGVAPSLYFDHSSVGLRSIGVEEDQAGALAMAVSGGYGINYALDVNAKVIYVVGGKPFIGADLQYLVYEARYTYISVLGGCITGTISEPTSPACLPMQ